MEKEKEFYVVFSSESHAAKVYNTARDNGYEVTGIKDSDGNIIIERDDE